MLQELDQEGHHKYRETKMGDEKYEPVPIITQFELFFSKIFTRIELSTNFSPIFCSLMIIIGFIQVFSIVFDESINFSVFDSISWVIRMITLNLGIYEALFTSDNKNWYFIVLYLYDFFIVVYITLLIFVARKKYDEYSILAYVTSICTAIIFWCLFLPMSKMYLLIFECDSDNHLKAHIKIICGSRTHIIHMVISLIFFIISTLLTLVITLFGNATNPSNKKIPLSRFDWNFEIVFFLLRLYIVLCSTFISDGVLRRGLIIWVLELYGIGQIMYYRKYCPYYSYTIKFVFGVSAYSLLLISTLTGLSEIFGSYFGHYYEGNTLLIVIGIIGSFRLVKNSL